MKTITLVLMLMFAAGCAVDKVESQKRAESAPSPETANPPAKAPVLVELFTSEGCSSCPPADRALAFLDREQPVAPAEIVTLAFHVDYWDDGGWKDPFSSAQFTARQEFYGQKFRTGSIYTPQMIVDGGTEFVGSNTGRATSAVLDAAKNPKGSVEIVRDGEKLKVKVSELPDHEAATLFLAVAEDELSSNVARGENSGQTLAHQSVARRLKPLGAIDPQQKSLESETVLTPDPGWKRENLKLIVFAQENTTRRIIAVGKIRF
ncbi:MAG: DUF1223 domain-containing protein [Acidobacteria bacterium]|nr:DUF1223 domain-containing protein [Acidobacteriota bacterium]